MENKIFVNITRFGLKMSSTTENLLSLLFLLFPLLLKRGIWKSCLKVVPLITDDLLKEQLSTVEAGGLVLFVFKEK